METERVCPSCSADLPLQTCISPEDAEPAPGDVSICFYCAELLVYDDDLNLSVCPEDDPYRNDPLVVRARAELIGQRGVDG